MKTKKLRKKQMRNQVLFVEEIKVYTIYLGAKIAITDWIPTGEKVVTLTIVTGEYGLEARLKFGRTHHLCHCPSLCKFVAFSSRAYYFN